MVRKDGEKNNPYALVGLLFNHGWLLYLHSNQLRVKQNYTI